MKLVLGTVQLGLEYGVSNTAGRPSLSESFDILDEAQKLGIKELDTAQSYGESERIIGEYLKRNPKSFEIMSKFSNVEDEDYRNSIENSLNTLGLENLKGMYFHKYSDFKNLKNSSTLLKLKEEGLIENLGVSIYEQSEFEDVLNSELIDIIQIPYNLLDCSVEKERLALAAKDKNKRIYSRSAFLQGLFFLPEVKIKKDFEELYESVMEIKKIAKIYNVTLEELALGFCLQEDFLDHILVGVNSKKELSKNILSSQVKLPSQCIQEIKKISVSNPKLLNPVHWKAI